MTPASAAPWSSGHAAAQALSQYCPLVKHHVRLLGKPRELAPAVLEECGLIAAEALRNAYLHAQANHIVAENEYGYDLLVQVINDGIGLDAKTECLGYRSDHWGLSGMHERAWQICAARPSRIQPMAANRWC